MALPFCTAGSFTPSSHERAVASAARRFHRLTRDIYLAAGDIGFWQGSLRDPLEDDFAQVRKAIDDRALMTIDLHYSDYEGAQRVISRFGLLPRQDGTWLPAPSRHWNLDRDDPR